ncbi:PEST proteolytic signal-containing nuclear protein-like [Dendronephthya gigantea]|uniref:PEST proteolytic signal-containing nuclear protein-like n=1 Tax=Dendronephthya gigantea TaxID=151771 RepID=UPI00106A337B|nr:PEST proteolytic signal-containing nuclear protein-like [Dendronephthya gigantea]
MAESRGKQRQNESDADEKIKLAVKRKAEIGSGVNHEKSSPAKMKFGITSSKGSTSGISIKVGQLKSTESNKHKVDIISKPKKGSVAAAFKEESDEEEEIPKEAKMRMRNLGKDTVTSSGPNSFNKGKQGFTNFNKVREKEMKLTKH